MELIFLIFLTANSVTFAQKIGVVDTNYILSKMPQYTEAQARLEEQIKAWETELQTLQAEYDAKKAAFENEKVLLVGQHMQHALIHLPSAYYFPDKFGLHTWLQDHPIQDSFLLVKGSRGIQLESVLAFLENSK